MDNNNLLQNAKNLLTRKEQLLMQFLKLCEDANFLGKEEEIEDYIVFLDDRQIIIEEVDKVDKLLSSITTVLENNLMENVNSSTDNHLQNNKILLQSKKEDIKKIVEKIINKDDTIKVNMNKLLSSLNSNMVRINTGRNAKSQYYAGDINNGGSFIDTKN